MAEHLDHLLPGHGFFYITVHSPKGCLLGRKILLAPSGHSAAGLHHERYENYGNQGQYHIGIKHQGQGTHNT